jgi:hypothetical protein
MEYDESSLVERARIAFAKASGMDQPSNDSDVQDVDGIPYAVLRNVNGILAVYSYNGTSLNRVHEWPDELN